MPAEIQSAIKAQLDSGDLITKDQHDKLVADATSAATTGARDAALAEIKRINERRLALTTASLPIPSDNVLSIEDAEFDPRKATAAKRVEELKPFNLPAERVLTLAWDTEQKAYDDGLTLIKAVFDNARKGTAANPMINRPGSDTTPRKPQYGLC
jgi:hypothetical protein